MFRMPALLSLHGSSSSGDDENVFDPVDIEVHPAALVLVLPVCLYPCAAF